MINKPFVTLKIGYILKRFPNLSQTFILNEILELERQGVLVEIISLRKPRSEPTHSGLNKLKAQITYLEDATKSSDSTVSEQVADWVKSRQIQHLHAHFATSAAEIAMQSAGLAKIGYSFTAHARDIYHEKVDQHALVRRIQHARFVVTVSDFNREYLNKLMDNHYCKGNIYRLYNGLDLELFRPAPLSQEPGLIVSIGRLVSKKGMSYLVEACAALRDRNVVFRTVIIGDGEERVSLEQSIKRLALEQQVTLVGALAQSDVIATLSCADLFVLPCIVSNDGDMDGLPTVILEAMAIGIPVISTRLAGIPEMIHHQINGMLVEQKQVKELADAIQTLLESNELRVTFRNQSLQHMEEHFNLRKNVAQLREWFTAANLASVQGKNNHIVESILDLSDAELVAYFANRIHVTYPDLPRVSDEQLKNAADILSDRFRYTGETFQFEPEFSWKANPSSDKEWQIAFHKHYFLIDLVQAYRHTGEVIYLDKWQHLIQSWITEMGSGYIILSDAQVEAKRMESWCIAFMLLKGTKWHERVPGCFLRQLLTRIAEETYYISQNLKPVRNHRTFQLYSIYLVGVLFPELSLNKYFRETGTELLSQNLLTDFHKDGVHIEMSSHYHQLVAETGIRMLELAILNHLNLSSDLVSRLHKAVRFSLYLQWPNGDIPLINDSDNGNHLDLLRLGSQYLNDSELLWGATLGVSGRAPKNASICFPDSGYFILGDTWGIDEQTYAERQHVFFDCGKLGEGSHSHYDLFNFCYYVDRKPAVIDPGRYTYFGEPDANGVNWRHYFKSTASHNTVTIDHQDQTLFLSRTKHGPEVNLEERDWLLGKKTDWIFGRALSPHYSPIHERLIVYMGHQYLFILDRLLSDDEIQHHYELNFHLPAGTNTDLIVQPNGYHLLTDECEIRVIANEDASARIKPGWVSQYYGTKHAAPIFSIEQTVERNSMFASVVSPKSSDNFLLQDFQRDQLNDTTYCFYVNFKVGKHYFNDRFIVSIADNEITLEKLNFYGRFIAYRQDSDRNVLFVSSQAMKEITIDGIEQRYPEGRNFEWVR